MESWIIKIFTITIVTIAISVITYSTLKIFENKLRKNKTVWDDLILSAAVKPLMVLIWILGANLIFKIIDFHLVFNISNEVFLSKNLGIIFCISWFAWRIVNKYELHLRRENKIVTSTNTIIKLAKALIAIITILMMMQTSGVSITGLVAFGGIGGIALGFASRDFLANIFGATMIYFDHPFSIGDIIKSPDRQIEGTVEHIGWRLTQVRSKEGKMLYIPNSIFSTIIIENSSRIKN